MPWIRARPPGIKGTPRQLGQLSPAAPPPGTPVSTARQRSQSARINAVFSVVQMVLRVRRGLRYPQRLTASAIAGETWDSAWYVVRAARAVRRGRPRIAAGSVLAAAGCLARLSAASAEPLS
jgi:hypothetical protein